MVPFGGGGMECFNFTGRVKLVLVSYEVLYYALLSKESHYLITEMNSNRGACWCCLYIENRSKLCSVPSYARVLLT